MGRRSDVGSTGTAARLSTPLKIAPFWKVPAPYSSLRAPDLATDMATSLGLVPTLPNARQGEGSRLLPEEDDLEVVSLGENQEAPVEGADYAPRLKKRIVWIYGLGETGIWASHVIIGFYLNTFLLEVAGLNASLVCLPHCPSSPLLLPMPWR